MKNGQVLWMLGLIFCCSNLLAQTLPLKTLKGTTVKQLKLYADSSAVIPGKTFKIGVEGITDKGNGKTKGWLNGEVGWKEFEVKVLAGGSYDFTNPGIITVSDKGDQFINDHVRIMITLKDNPSITAQLDVPVQYKIEITLNFYGSTGPSGAKGNDGSYVGAGSGVAQPGTDGGKGFKGPTIEVYVKPIMVNGKNILEARVVNTQTQKTATYKVDPDGGKLIVYSTGGQGGQGGAGGRGDASHEKCVVSNGAAGGRGGEGGDGGDITFYFDPSVKQYQGIFIGYSTPGKGGEGGNGGSGGGIVSCTGKTGVFTPAGSKGQGGAKGLPGQPGSTPKFVVQ